MSISIEPLRDDLSFGCRVRGVTEQTLRDEAVRRQLFEAFERDGVILFEGVEPTNRMQVQISQGKASTTVFALASPASGQRTAFEMATLGMAKAKAKVAEMSAALS